MNCQTKFSMLRFCFWNVGPANEEFLQGKLIFALKHVPYPLCFQGSSLWEEEDAEQDVVWLQIGKLKGLCWLLAIRLFPWSSSIVSSPVKEIESNVTLLYLNVCDLKSINRYLYWFGHGIFHSGIEGQWIILAGITTFTGIFWLTVGSSELS